jgi:hypothetical protein
MANADEEIARMIAEDELDAAREGITKMSVIKYGRARGIQPQLIYYHIRTGKIKQELCVCGDKVIDVQSADAFFSEKEAAEKKKAGGVSDASLG